MENLYQSENWKSLKGLDRAQLLLVIEGLKRGTIINGNMHSFVDILEKAGLEYRLNTSKYILNPIFVVARSKDLLEEMRKNLTLPANAKSGDYHKIYGWLLGYPACCTEEYLKERTPSQKMAIRNGQKHLSYKFGEELEAKIKVEGSYPEIFDYVPPTFTPCGIECPEATKMLASYKDAITCLDPEAGMELVKFNRYWTETTFF